MLHTTVTIQLGSIMTHITLVSCKSDLSGQGHKSLGEAVK